MNAESLRFLGTINQPEVLAQKSQSLQKEFEEHEGEFVLMVTRRWERLGCGPSPLGFPSHLLETTLYLGLIEPSLAIAIDRWDFSIPTAKHIKASKDLGRENVSLEEGSIKDYFASIWNLDMPVGENQDNREWGYLDKGDETKPALEIVVGDEAVKAWFLNQAQYGRMGDFREIVEDPNTDSETVERLKKKHFDSNPLILYQKMQALLGRKIPSLSPEIQARVEAKVLKQKEGVLASLETLIRQEAELTENLARIRGIKLPRIVVDSLGDNQYEREVQRDEEDLRIIKSIPVNEERRRAQGQIKAKLKEALELGMHKDPWVIVREPKPGQRIETDVPRLIHGYCEYYEIPVPQGKDSNK